MKEKAQYMGNTTHSFHSIIKYPELEETHKDHQIQDLAPQRTTQNSNHMSESTVQMLLDFWQFSTVTAALGNHFSVSNHSLVKNLFLIPNLTLPDTASCCSLKSFCCQQKDQCCPSTPVMKCCRQNGVTCSSYVLPSRLFTVFIVLL